MVSSSRLPRARFTSCNWVWLIGKKGIETRGGSAVPAPVVTGRAGLVADREQDGYAAQVDHGACGIAIWRSGVTRALMLVIGVLAYPSSGLIAPDGSDCTEHKESSKHQKMGQSSGHWMPDPGSTSWDAGSTHDCPHCAPTECVRLAPCAASTMATAPLESFAGIHLPVGHVRALRLEIHSCSTTHQPPTPPPQLIS